MDAKYNKMRGRAWILTYYRDSPDSATLLNLNKEVDRDYLKALVELVNEADREWGLCEFKNEDCYRKGRRLVGQHRQLRRSGKKDVCGYSTGIPIGKFQRLVQPLGYKNLPLTKGEEKSIREEHKFRDYSVAKLADDWDVSESHIWKVLKRDKPSVLPSKESINIGTFKGQPPVPGRVVPKARGSTL
jgi:hypothetical protein